MNRTLWILCALSAALAPASATGARATEAKSTATATIRIDKAPAPAGKTAPATPTEAAPGAPGAAATAPAAGAAAPLPYPGTRRGDVVDDYFGTKVADPYRWLEDADSPETRAWIDAQNAVTFGYLQSIPERARIRERLTKLWNYPKYTVPTREGDWYVYTKNQGLQNQSVTYKQRSLDGEPSVLIDPNLLSKDGTVALSTTASAFTNDGRLYAYGTSKAGSDWMEYQVREVESGRDLPDHLQYIKFSEASWTGDGKGFFYGRYPKPEGNALTSTNRDQKIYYHALGTDQAKDRLVYERPDKPDWAFGATVTKDGHYVVVTQYEGTDERNRVYTIDLADSAAPRLGAPVVPLIEEFDANYDFVGNDGATFFFETDLDAPRGRLIAIDTRLPARAGWRTVVPEGTDALENVTFVNNQFIASYLHDAYSRVGIFTIDGQHVRDVAFPTLGKAAGFKGKRADTETFYSFTSYLYPTTIFRYDLTTGTSSVFRAPEIDFDPSGYETEQVFATSKDGTRIPVFLTHKKGMARDGTNPTLLYGYGGFKVPVTPAFSPSTLVWLEMGGLYAVANLRGGGEYGEEWHAAGMLDKKQNVFDDFIGAGEFLIREGYTSKERLAIMGGSNGGLLVGAAMTQRPDLFAAAVPVVGVLDMLRFEKFTIGWGWKSDYGSAADPAGFRTLRAYSPLQNLKPGTEYPATLVMTGDHDDRVVPAHSFKFAAALQAAQAGREPVLIRVATDAGHGAGKPTTKIIEEQTDMWAFLLRNLGMTLAPAGTSDGL